MSGNLEKSNLHDDSAFQKAADKKGLFEVGPNGLDNDIGRRAYLIGAEEDTHHFHSQVIVAVPCHTACSW